MPVEQGKRDLVQAMADQLGVSLNAIGFMGRLGIKEIQYMMSILPKQENIQGKLDAEYERGVQAGKDLMLKTLKKD
jgi:hypothetical protein